MHPDLPAVRLLAAVATRADDAILRDRRRSVTDDARLLEIAGKLGMTIALDAAAEALDFPTAVRQRLVASSMLVALARDASLRLLDELRDAGVPAERAIVIKGGALALAFPSTANRAVCDADVVVPTVDVAAWLEAATRIGAHVEETAGYEAAHFTRDRGMIELHLALPGFAGNDAGPGWDALCPRAVAIAGQPWLMPEAPVAREIAVQHFLFHHGGEAGHALRTLQDLSLLEDRGEGDGLSWDNPAVARATTRLRSIALAIRDGRDDDPEAAAFLGGLTSILDETTGRSFAEESREWLEQKPGALGKAALLARRLVPRVSEMRHSPDDTRLTVAARYVTRPFELIRKYRAAKQADRARGSAVAEWKAEVARLAR
ncbi:MAG: nucleotidyltransferase family protein [Thermoanaerobaculia bacterium]